MWQHHRTDDHHGPEDASTVALTEAIGRYPAGSLLSYVLADMAARISQVELDTGHGFFTAALDAVIVPYSGAAGATGLFGLNAVIRAAGTGTFGLDAVLEAPTAVERSRTFGLNAYFVARGADGISVITAPIGPGDTIVEVDDPGEFPGICPFDIIIGNEVMTVVAGCGTSTWTVERTDPAASHPAGSYVATC